MVHRSIHRSGSLLRVLGLLESEEKVVMLEGDTVGTTIAVVFGLFIIYTVWLDGKDK